MNKKQKREFYENIRASWMPKNQQDYVFSVLAAVLGPKEPKEKKIRAVRTKSPLVTLEAWEAQHGVLTWPMVREWGVRKQLCPRTTSDLIEEFRTEMKSKGKEYADFVATFQTYLNKGYLSKKLPQVLWVNSIYRKEDSVHIGNRGASI